MWCWSPLEPERQKRCITWSRARSPRSGPAASCSIIRTSRCCSTARPLAGCSWPTITGRPTGPSRPGKASDPSSPPIPTAAEHKESTMLITADTVATGRELLRPGWIDVDHGSVRAVGAGDPPRPADLELGAVTVVPGFVDMHVHGGGGGAFPAADPSLIESATATAVDLHRRHGTTTMVASLVTAHPTELLAQVRVLANQVQSGLVAGIHLEGPWLAAKRCGAHELSALRDPDPAELDRVIE